MTTHPARFLIVDDNEDNRYLLGERLAMEGYTNIATAQNGREALDLLRAQAFDCVLLDIMMPDMNGFQVLEALRADPRLSSLPVIVVSAADQLEAAIRSIELGAVDYLPKPVNPTLLRARVGAVIEKKRLHDQLLAHVARIDRELAFARDLQLSMVPRDFREFAPAAALGVHALLEPAREIGGDFYDYFWMSPERLCVVVADVADKGISAALFMTRAKTALRLLAKYDSAAGSAADLLAQLNDELCNENPHAMYVTMVLIVIDVGTGRITWCNAGHPPPFIVGPDGATERLAGASGVPLGLRPAMPFSEGTTSLPPGTSLFAYTDGITEATNAAGELYGQTRLSRALSAHATQTPEAMLGAVLAAVREFSGSPVPVDDIAALVCRRLA